MKFGIEVSGPPGSLARAPGRALKALADVAEADGADRDEWLQKAAQEAAGATEVRVSVLREPRHRVVRDAREEATRVFNLAMTLARAAVVERLEKSIDERARQAREAADATLGREAPRKPDGNRS